MTPERASLWKAVITAFTVIVAALVVAGAYVRGHSADETIRVVGSARKPIHSDYIIWTGRVTETAPTTAQGYAALTAHVAQVEAYLRRKGIGDTEITPSAITTKTVYARVSDNNSDNQVDDNSKETIYRPIAGYQFMQDIVVQSADVPRIDAVSRQSTELISKGIAFESEPPQYLYTKLSDLKVTMQADAARDARARAEQIAASAGCRLGAVRHANMNAPVITPLYSSAITDGGVDDTTALDKRITAVVTIEYAVR